MFGRALRAAFAAFVLCAGAVAAPPLETYGKLPPLGQMKLSPSGAYYAYVRGSETKRAIIVQKLGTAQAPVIIDVTGQKLRSLEWASDSHLIFTTSSTTVPKGFRGKRSEWFVPQVLDLKTNSLRTLFGETVKKYAMMNVLGGALQYRTIGGHDIVFAKGLFFPTPSESRLGLFRIDMNTGEVVLASRESDRAVEDWVVDENGKVLAMEQYFENDETYRLSIYRDSGKDIVLNFDASIESPGTAGLSEDGKSILLYVPQKDDSVVYEQVSLTDGTRSKWTKSELAPEGVIIDDRTGRAIGGIHPVDKDAYTFFDPRVEGIWQSVQAAFKGATNIDITTQSVDYTKLIVKVFGTQYGSAYYYIDMTSHNAFLIAPEYDGIKEVSEVKWINYKAADGRVIYAYLTLPMGRDAKNLPLVVLPHGGPHARDGAGFDWWSQGVASLGYAVLQPQFRGSDGFGAELLKAGYNEIGKKMQTDLSDGVRALAAQGIIDPKRVCIAGASYGGYAALAGATLDTGVYRCAVSVAGVSNMGDQVLYFQKKNPKNKPDRGTRFWLRFLGVESTSDSKIDAVNPDHHADRITIPVLLIHGKDDTVVPYVQSLGMASAMKSAGKPVEFVTLEGEDHWLSSSATRLKMLQELAAFLQKHNPAN